MFKNNVGKIDRILRVVVGAGLLASFFLFPEFNWRPIFLIGIIPLATGLMSSCPLYSLLGLSSCPMKKT